MTENGVVKKFFTDKGFGFIYGNNGVEYFFHKSELADKMVFLGDFVTFEPSFNHKGRFAKHITLNDNFTIQMPEKIFFENKIPKEYDILEHSSWRVSNYNEDGRFTNNRLFTKNILKRYAEVFGANVLLDVDYEQGEITKEDAILDHKGRPIGWHKYSVKTHRYSATLGRIGKKISSKSQAKEYKNVLHKIPLDTLIDETQKYRKEKYKFVFVRWFILFVIFVVILQSVFNLGLIFSMMIALGACVTIMPRYKISWLEKIND